MHEKCFFSDSIVRAQEVGVSLTALISAAGLYGKGFFTTLAIRDGRPVLFEKHWARLSSASRALETGLGRYGRQYLENVITKLLAENGVVDGRCRITFFDASASPMWPGGGQRNPLLLITTADSRPHRENIKLTLSPHHLNTTSPLVGIKSCNYLDPMLAFEEARKRGFQEAIRLNERVKVASACMANVFWETGGKLFTPSLRTGCLAGTTREYILENLECEEVEAGIDELEKADRIFLTSAGIGVVNVADFDGRQLDTTEHPLSSLPPF